MRDHLWVLCTDEMNHSNPEYLSRDVDRLKAQAAKDCAADLTWTHHTNMDGDIDYWTSSETPERDTYLITELEVLA